MPLGINDKDRIEKDRKGSDWIGSQILFQDGKRIGSDCRSIFDKRIGIGSQIQKKRIVQFSGPRVTWRCLGGLSSPEELEELDPKFAYLAYFMPRMLNRSEISGRNGA